MTTVSRASNSGAVLFEHACQAYARGNRSQAVLLANQTLEQQPNHAGAFYMLGAVALDNGQAAQALPHLQAAAELDSRQVGILRALGMAHFILQHWEAAVQTFQRALQLGLSDPGILNNLGSALKELGRVQEAIQAYREALRLSPENASIHNNLAIALNATQDYQAAIRSYRRSTQLDPKNADVWANLATLLEQSNRLEEAEEAIARGLKLDPQHGNLLLIAAKCKRRHNAPDAAIAQLREALEQYQLHPFIRMSMEFELGRSYDQINETDQAFAHFASGHRLSTQIWPNLLTDGRNALAELERLLEYFTAHWTRNWPDIPPVPETSRLAFLVGFARSGTTLMDTMLGAHPQISVLEEEPCLTEALNQVKKMPQGYPRALERLNATGLAELRACYWRSAGQLGCRPSPHMLVVDKHPYQSAAAAFIHRLFPAAPFVLALRHPCDVVVSCYMHGAGNYPLTANFTALDTTALAYARVMDLWLRYRELFPLRVHELRYEKLVKDKTTELRNLLDFLGLPWSENLTDHTAHARHRGRIYTPSYHQVVQPIYKHAIDRWRRYEHHLGGILPILRPYIETFGYSA